MDQLWGIALRANNTDVSLNAIQYLNNYYINCKSDEDCWHHIRSLAHNCGISIVAAVLRKISDGLVQN